MKKTTATLLSLTLFSALLASAVERNSADPYEPHNRFVFNINDKVDHHVLAPVARDYRKVTPKPVCVDASSFFNSPRDAVGLDSDVLRLNAKHTSENFVRVSINTISGLGGLIDVAGTGGILDSKNTLGDTLTSRGQKNGNYFIVPLLGSSTVRDMTGSIIATVYPVKNVMFHTSAGRWSTIGPSVVNNRERSFSLTDSLEGTALDKHNYTRDLYMRMRARQTGDTLPQTPDDDIDVDELVDNGKSSNLSPAETADALQIVSAPVAEGWVHIHPEGGGNAGQVQ